MTRPPGVYGDGTAIAMVLEGTTAGGQPVRYTFMRYGDRLYGWMDSGASGRLAIKLGRHHS